MSTRLSGIGFDSAYQALDEIFAGHPLKPALFTAYFEGALFSRISDMSEVPAVEEGSLDNRFRDFHDNAQLFWAMMNEIYGMEVRQYKVWIKLLWTVFSELLVSAAKGKSEEPKLYEALHNAIIRDYRYFGENDKAEQLEKSGISDNPQQIAVGELQALFSDLDPKNDKSGYSLARRLCVRERPLVLKFLGDQILATGWYIKQSGGFDHMTQYFHFPPRFRFSAQKTSGTLFIPNLRTTKVELARGGSKGRHSGIVSCKVM